MEPTPEDIAAATPAPTERRGDLQQKISYLPNIHRMLPSAPDAERGVLCSYLIDPRTVGAMCSEKNITAAHFHIPAHAMIFTVLAELWAADKPIDFIILTGIFKKRGELDQVGGVAFISDLFTYVGTAANASVYIETIEEKFTLREIIKVCTEYAARSYDEQDDPPGLLAAVEGAILKIGQQRPVAPAVSIKEHIFAAVRRLESLHENKALTGLSTGFAAIDDVLDGLHRQEMIVIAARPSCGKTSMATNIAEHIAIDLRLPVVIFSLEMSTAQLVDRMLFSRAHINTKAVRHYGLAERDYPAITRSASAISEATIIIEDDARYRTVEHLIARARQLKQKHPKLAAVFVDYFTLLKWGGKQKNDNRTNELTEVSHALKGMAKSLDLPVILLAQISRQYNERIGRPQLSDLKECGALEEDADVVGFLDREEMHAANDDERKECEGRAELMIRKQRNGALGDVPLTFLKEFTRFTPRYFGTEEDEYVAPQLPMYDPHERKRKSEL